MSGRQTQTSIFIVKNKKFYFMSQSYNIGNTSTTSEVKKISFHLFTTSGKRKEIKNQILHYLQFRDLTARELSVYIKCMRSSVCNALHSLVVEGSIYVKGTTFDRQTERNVTLYSLQNSETP